jgi:shikimate kinase
MENKPIIFQGMCYSGKSTLGKITADILGVPFLDSRDLFFKVHGMSEIDYLKQYGRENFKEAERKSLHHDFIGVFSCGGSAIYYPDEMKMLNDNYTIVWLDVDFDLIVKRKAAEGWERPIVFPDGINSFKELYEQRRSLYKQLDSVIVKVTEEEDIKATSQKIIRALISN